MDVFKAIAEMRKISKERGNFSFAFMSYSDARGTSNGVVEVTHARLRPQSTVEKNKFADIMLNYVNLDTDEYGMCYQPLLMEFNGEPLELT